MSAEQLERSILERKASDELRAIATAMSLEPAARVKKADLVNQILRAAGVEVDAPSQNGNGNGNGKAAAAEAVAAPAAEAGEPAASNGRATKPRTNRSRAKKETATPDAAQAAGEATPAVAAPTEVPSTEATAPESTTAAGQSSTAAEPAPAAGDANGDRAGEQKPVEQRSFSADHAGGSPSGDGAQGSVQTQNRPQRDRQQFQGGAGNQQGGEPGNRRGRRRRGRDRERGERDLQGGGQGETPYQGELVSVKGLLDLRDEGYGFLRTSGYLPSQKDVYVSVSQARRFGLRRGDAIEGACRPAGPSEKYPALLRIDTICGMTPEEASHRRRFEDLTPLFPDERLRLERVDDPANVTARIVDLISPIGKGQRGLIVSPPKAGKTTVLKQIAHSIEANNPDVHLMVLLVEERPEEVTDMRRSVRGEVIASTFDRPSDEHTAVSELAIERAKRLVELGKDVVIILDGITRLARAYNLAQPATGRIMSGGVDSGALYPPRKFFGAARNIEEGGSLTILATALVETGSKMDEVIFEEFKGTGNMELRLDRKLAERRIYPAIDVNASSTRHEELLFDRGQLQQVWKLRRVLNALGAEGNAAAGLELLMDKIKTTRSNDEFLLEIAKAPTV